MTQPTMKSRKLAWVVLGVVVLALVSGMLLLAPTLSELLFYGEWHAGAIVLRGEVVHTLRHCPKSLSAYKRRVMVKRLEVSWLPLRSEIVRTPNSDDEWWRSASALPPHPSSTNPFGD